MPEIPRRRVAVVGATGVAGQQFLVALASHPWFEVTALAASPLSAGKTYREAITEASGQLRWSCEESLPEQFADRGRERRGARARRALCVAGSGGVDLVRVPLRG